MVNNYLLISPFLFNECEPATLPVAAPLSPDLHTYTESFYVEEKRYLLVFHMLHFILSLLMAELKQAHACSGTARHSGRHHYTWFHCDMESKSIQALQRKDGQSGNINLDVDYHGTLKRSTPHAKD